MKPAIVMCLAALPTRLAFTPAPPSAGWYGQRGAVTQVRPRTTRSDLLQLFDGALSNTFRPEAPGLITRCAMASHSGDAEPQPLPVCVIPKLTGTISDQDLLQVVSDAVPSLGRRSLETTLRLIWAVYEEDFRAGCAASGARPLPPALKDRVAVDHTSDLYCRAVNDHMVITRNEVNDERAGTYLHTRVIFRGTVMKDGRDMAVDAKTFIPRKVRVPVEDQRGRVVTVGEGYIQRYVELAPTIIETLGEDAALARQRGIRHEVTFAGHSLGASVGIYGAVDHVERQKSFGVSGPPVRVVALSPPKVGYFDEFNQLLLEHQEHNRIRAFQLRHRGDPVSSMPTGAQVPVVPLIEIEGVAGLGISAMDNHELEMLVDRFTQVIDGECRVN